MTGTGFWTYIWARGGRLQKATEAAKLVFPNPVAYKSIIKKALLDQQNLKTAISVEFRTGMHFTNKSRGFIVLR